MNLPGFDWSTGTVKPGTPYKSLQQQFINVLSENNLIQFIREPTHFHGNTLDIVCISDKSIISSVDVNVITPSLSNHCIITARLIDEGPTSQINENKKRREIYIHREADADKFSDHMSVTCDKLSRMNDVEKMWVISSTTFREAIALSVPKQTVKMRREDQPTWFNRKAEKLLNTRQALCIKNSRIPEIHILPKGTKSKGVKTKRPSGKSSVNISRLRSANHLKRVIASLSTSTYDRSKNASTH